MNVMILEILMLKILQIKVSTLENIYCNCMFIYECVV